MDDNSDILNKVLKHLFSLLTESNKDILLRRIATIYNSVSEEKRKTMDRVDIMYHEVSVDKSLFDIPDYSIKVNKDKPKTLKKSSKSRNPICIQKENEFMRKIRSKEPLVIDSTTLNSLERCAVREDINKEGENKPTEISNELSTQPVETMPLETQPVETMPLETQPVEKIPLETQPVETMPLETQPVEKIPLETQPVEKMPLETQPVETMQPLAAMPPLAATQPISTMATTQPLARMATTQPVETMQPLAATQPVETMQPLAATQPVALCHH